VSGAMSLERSVEELTSTLPRLTVPVPDALENAYRLLVGGDLDPAAGFMISPTSEKENR